MPAGPASAVVPYTMRAVHPSPRAADTSVTSGSSGFSQPPLSSWLLLPLPPLLLLPGVGDGRCDAGSFPIARAQQHTPHRVTERPSTQ